MKKRTIYLLGVILAQSCLVLLGKADQSPPVLVFGGKQFHVGSAAGEADPAMASAVDRRGRCKLSGSCQFRRGK